MDKIIDDNNKIVGNINLDNSNIKFIGKNNILYVDNGITLVNSSIEFRGDNSLVYLCKTNDKLTIDVKIYNNSTLYFGKNMWINKGIKTGDPHIIYDINTRKRVNHSKSVYIGDHVWIGQHVMILKNTMIGSGSVIGAMSLVTNKKYSSNGVYAGTPAKKIRSDIFFIKDDCHRFLDDDIDRYEYNYSNDFIYDKDNTTISFNDIEKNLRCLSIEDRIKYLNDISSNMSKNRFYIE